MQVTSVRIENFRSIRHLDVKLGATTVFIGPNNSGKSAILEALRIALTRRWGARGTGFTEYDVHLANDADDPKASPGIVIEVRVEESEQGEWPEAIHQALTDIVQDDPLTGRASITLRVSCRWSPATSAYEPTWHFLNAARQPLSSGSARRVNLERFWQYLPVFYLGALRDANDEFSGRSQFWGRLLKAMEIPQSLEGRVQRVLNLLNRRLLRADRRLEQIARTLSTATRIAARDRDGSAELRLTPLRSWDLLSKAEIILRNEPDWPWLPLNRHGQGIQSLSVIFLFQAFVEHLLADLYEPESSPLLALEEPETHLHPQAARTLWNHVSAVSGQKIITTHSPYFVQHVPFRDLRIVRLGPNGTEVRALPATFAATIPYVPDLDPIVARHRAVLKYDQPLQTLTVGGKLEEDVYRELLIAYGLHEDRQAVERTLRQLREESVLFISDTELRALETYARRIRGEIFFARRWILVEGQAEYLLVHSLARALRYDLDERGVSVIDTQNNGNPAMFAALARALGIPWIAIFDGDQAGQRYIDSIGRRGFEQATVTSLCALLPVGSLEQQLVADGLTPELKQVLSTIGVRDVANLDAGALQRALDTNKIAYVAELAARVEADAGLAARMPQVFRDAIVRLGGLE